MARYIIVRIFFTVKCLKRRLLEKQTTVQDFDCMLFVYYSQGRSQEFATGKGDKGGVWGRKSPSWVQGQNPQKPETHANFQLRRGTCTHAPLGYATDYSCILVLSKPPVELQEA